MSGAALTGEEVVTVGEPLPRIAAAMIVDDRRVRVTWRNGSSVTVDFAPILLSKRLFIPLRADDELFGTMRVNEDGNALEWDGGIELTAEWIERMPRIGMENDEFRAIMGQLGYSLDGMAAALEISRRQVAEFRGTKPIPAAVGYATRYLAEHGTSGPSGRAGKA